MKRLAAVVLALALILVPLQATAFAAVGERYTVTSGTAHNAAVQAKELALEEKYAITINYSTYWDGETDVAVIQPETLDTLDTALSYVSTYVVRQVSSYYQQNTGKRLRITYRCQDLSGSVTNEYTVAGFDPDLALIEIYIPQPGTDAQMNGDSPLSLLHEFGHAVHIMMMRRYGSDKMQQEWESINGGYRYSESNIAQNPNEKVFMSAYAATSYMEDFAEVFAHAFVCNRAGLGLSNRLSADGASTALGKKFASALAYLKAYFPDSTEMHQNYAKVYTTPTTLTYNNAKFSGPHLQFIGYAEARYFAISILEKRPDIRPSSYRWVSAIGGWVAANPAGGYVVVFPDGTWGETAHQLL